MQMSAKKDFMYSLGMSLVLVCIFCFTPVQQVQAESLGVHGGRAADTAKENQPKMIIQKTNEADVFGSSEKVKSYALSLDEDDEYMTPTRDKSDPLLPWNKFWFGFNDILMRGIIKPLYIGYEFVMPEPLRIGVNNVFENAFFPVRFVSNIFIGRFTEAGVEFSRFMVNTVFGLGGLIDIGSSLKPLWCEEPGYIDIGLALAYWGVGEGPYIVWPVFGPSNLRDSVGWAAGLALQPTTYNIAADAVRYSINGGRIFNALGNSLDNYEELRRISVEPYVALKYAYQDNRRFLEIKKKTKPGKEK